MRLFSFLLLLLIPAFLSAQVCTGSVGDPIINITFGRGDGFGPPLPAGTTSSLSYQADNCPGDGNYAITNRTAGCWASDVVWHTATDHTGDGNGYYMLINASYQPSDFYIQTVTGLCSGTTYQFAAWLLNMCSVMGGLPNITMTIEKLDGTVLAKYQTGDIPIVNPVSWKQYGFVFTTPQGVSAVVLRMRNNAPGGVGNDVGLDDITFRPVGPSVSVAASGGDGNSIVLCEKDQSAVTLTSSVERCFLAAANQWQRSEDNGITWQDIPGETNASFTRLPTPAGTFLYRLAVAEGDNISTPTCRIASKPFAVVVNPSDQRTIAIAQTGGPLCSNSAVRFTANITYGGSHPGYQWQVNGNATGNNDSVFTTHTLMSGDIINCILTSSLACNSPLISNNITVVLSKPSSSTLTKTICEGESFEKYTQSGTYRDTFANSTGCDSIRTLVLTVHEKKETTFDTTICYGNSYQNHSTSGTYTTTYVAANGCDSLVTLRLTVLPDINRSVWNDTLLCTGDSLVLFPGEWDSYLWQDGSTNNHFTVHSGGHYNVAVSNQCGTTIKEIEVKEQVCKLAFPSAFTPNGDGRNDIFRVVNGYNLHHFKLVVYNRWGQIIFQTSKPTEGWNGLVNGNPATPGVYVWFCNYMRANDAGLVKTKGFITLLR